MISRDTSNAQPQDCDRVRNWGRKPGRDTPGGSALVRASSPRRGGAGYGSRARPLFGTFATPTEAGVRCVEPIWDVLPVYTLESQAGG